MIRISGAVGSGGEHVVASICLLQVTEKSTQISLNNMRINCSHNGKVQEIGQDPALFLCIYGGSTSLRFGFNLKPAFTQSQDSSL
jgi:hypothetical protein